MKGFIGATVISICGLLLYKYLLFTLLVNATWLNIFNRVVSDPILPVLGCMIVYFCITLEMSSISVTISCGILIAGGCVPVLVTGFLLKHPKADPDTGNGFLDISSNITFLNEVLKCRLFMLR